MKQPNTKVVKEVSTSTGNTGLIIFIIFLVLKLTGAVGWSWWIVTAPLWLPIAFVLAILGLIFGFIALVVLLGALF